ncbi:hypothetical protein QKW60_02440 [Defluviimonas aestuarii]|uniref:hypothetical protein n=1 Tax=Albidovulum aestuarii TaxID=1130726 RepID=UPI00249BFAAF|nr:hypothetical protein [Defluviimonas aestuarii]MDI3335252.1 hypothetical protein [Defluviimonas aestuarii]
MRYVQALISLGLFGWLSWSVATGAFPGGDGGSSKTRALKSMVGSATDNFGVMPTAAGLAVIGIGLALFFLLRRGEEAEA